MTPQERNDIDGRRGFDELTGQRNSIQHMLFRHWLCGGLLVGSMATLLLVTLFQAVTP